MAVSWWTVRLISVVIALYATAAAAQPSPTPAPDAPAPEQPAAEQKPPAVVAFEAGRALMDRQQYAEACSTFEESIRIDPDAPGTMLNLGLCHAELDHLATSLKWFRKAWSRASENGASSVFEQAAKEKTQAIAPKVPTLAIDAPRNATVTLDGERVADTDLARIEVDAGDHVVEMTVTGEKPVREQLQVIDGQHRRVVLKLPPKLVWVDRGGAARKRAYLLGAAGLGVWALDVGVLVIAKHNYDATDHPDQMQTWQNVARYGGTTLFVAGGVAIAGAAYLYWKSPGKEQVEQQRAVVPVVGPGQLGVAAYGSF